MSLSLLALTFFLFGGAAALMGNAIAETWRPWWQNLTYGALLAVGDQFLGLPLSDWEDAARAYPPSEFMMFVAIGYTRMNGARREKYAAAKAAGYRLASYVSSHCRYLSSTPPGDNCMIFEDNTIQPFVTIGNNVTLWSGGVIGHDSVVEDH